MDTARDIAVKLALGSLLLAWVVAMGALQHHAQAQVGSPAAPTSPAASAASAPVFVPPASVTPAPATRAAERARTPGELRPEQPVVPQVAVPLRRDGMAPNDTPVTGAAPVQDAAARCLAIKSAVERRACERGLATPKPSSASAPVPARRP